MTASLRTESRTTCNFYLAARPFRVALIVTLLRARVPVTNPAASTLAIDGFSDVHLIAASVRGLPLEVRATDRELFRAADHDRDRLAARFPDSRSFEFAHVHRGISGLPGDHRAYRHHARARGRSLRRNHPRPPDRTERRTRPKAFRRWDCPPHLWRQR